VNLASGAKLSQQLVHLSQRTSLRHLVDAPHGSSSHRKHGGIGAVFNRHETIPHDIGRKLDPLDPWRIVEFFG